MSLIRKEFRLDSANPIDGKAIAFLDRCGHKQSEIIKTCLARMADIIPVESSKDSDMVLRLIQMISLNFNSSMGTGSPVKVKTKAKKRNYSKPSRDNSSSVETVIPKKTEELIPEPPRPKEIVMSDEDVMSELGTNKSPLAIDDEEREIFKRMLASDPDLDRGSED